MSVLGMSAIGVLVVVVAFEVRAYVKAVQENLRELDKQYLEDKHSA